MRHRMRQRQLRAGSGLLIGVVVAGYAVGTPGLQLWAWVAVGFICWVVQGLVEDGE